MSHLIRVALTKQLIEQMFGPHNTMDRFTGGVTDGAAREGFLVGLWLALVALCGSLNKKKISNNVGIVRDKTMLI